MLYNLF